jgi:hypothetical protein
MKPLRAIQSAYLVVQACRHRATQAGPEEQRLGLRGEPKTGAGLGRL